MTIRFIIETQMGDDGWDRCVDINGTLLELKTEEEAREWIVQYRHMYLDGIDFKISEIITTC